MQQEQNLGERDLVLARHWIKKKQNGIPWGRIQGPSPLKPKESIKGLHPFSGVMMSLQKEECQVNVFVIQNKDLSSAKSSSGQALNMNDGEQNDRGWWYVGRQWAKTPRESWSSLERTYHGRIKGDQVLYKNTRYLPSPPSTFSSSSHLSLLPLHLSPLPPLFFRFPPSFSSPTNLSLPQIPPPLPVFLLLLKLPLPLPLQLLPLQTSSSSSSYLPPLPTFLLLVFSSLLFFSSVFFYFFFYFIFPLFYISSPFFFFSSSFFPHFFCLPLSSSSLSLSLYSTLSRKIFMLPYTFGSVM